MVENLMASVKEFVEYYEHPTEHVAGGKTLAAKGDFHTGELE